MIPKYDRAWKLFEGHPERWKAGFCQHDKGGNSIWSGMDTRAASWSILGAMIRCYSDGVKSNPEWLEALGKIRKMFGQEELLYDWEDKSMRTHEEVVSLLKELDV